MSVKEVYEFMNQDQLAVLSTVTDSGQPQAAFDGNGGDTTSGSHFRHGEEFAKISQLEGKSPRRLSGWLHNASFRAI
jgi:hypothetical protein